MKTFTPVDSAWIKGRGRSFTGPNPYTAAEDVRQHVGDFVLVGNQAYRILGVEHFMLAPPSLGDPIGLLLDADDNGYFSGYISTACHPRMAATGSEGRCELCGQEDSLLHVKNLTPKVF